MATILPLGFGGSNAMLFLLKIAVKGQQLTKQVNLVACKGKGSSAGEVTARFLAEMFALVPIQNVILEIGND